MKTNAFVNAYIVHRRYGGPEEGGWWFNEGFPLAYIDVTDMNDEDALKIHDILESAYKKLYSQDEDTRTDIYVQNHRAKHFPTHKPIYQ